MHGASSAQSCATSELRTRQTKMVTQDPQKRCVAVDDDGLLPAVDGKQVAHSCQPPKIFRNLLFYHHCTLVLRNADHSDSASHSRHIPGASRLESNQIF